LPDGIDTAAAGQEVCPGGGSVATDGCNHPDSSDRDFAAWSHLTISL